MKKRAISLVLVLILVSQMSGGALAAVSDSSLDTAVSKSLSYLYGKITSPTPNDTGGEWVIVALARGGYNVSDSYYADYYAALESKVTNANGILHKQKYTEYSRTLLALSAIGKDARNVAGYDLTAPLGDYNQTIWQGNNGAIWALIALDTVGYTIPTISDADRQATRQKYIDRILEKQLSDGGWVTSANGSTPSDPDMTGMALQALAKYRDQPAVATAIDKALTWLSSVQNSTGGFSTTASGKLTETSESAAQVVVALCELGIDPEDSRFVKNGNSVLSNLISFRLSNGGFKHVSSGSVNQMASEQGTYALVAAQRFRKGQNSLYDMTDVIKLADAPIILDVSGNNAGITMNSDGSISFSLKAGTNTITVTGKNGSFSVSCPLACVVVVENAEDGTFTKKTITTSGDSHTFTVEANEKLHVGLKGDATGDGKLNARDATLINRTTAFNGSELNSSMTDCQKLFADATGDGKVNARDATLLLRTVTFNGSQLNSSISW